MFQPSTQTCHLWIQLSPKFVTEHYYWPKENLYIWHYSTVVLIYISSNSASNLVKNSPKPYCSIHFGTLKHSIYLLKPADFEFPFEGFKEHVFVVVCNLQIFYMMKNDAHFRSKKGMGINLFLENKHMIILNCTRVIKFGPKT